MRSFDYDAVTYDAGIYCIDCLPTGIDASDDDVHPVFADSEWDYIPVCCECGMEHDYVTITGNE